MTINLPCTLYLVVRNVMWQLSGIHQKKIMSHLYVLFESTLTSNGIWHVDNLFFLCPDFGTSACWNFTAQFIAIKSKQFTEIFKTFKNYMKKLNTNSISFQTQWTSCKNIIFFHKILCEAFSWNFSKSETARYRSETLNSTDFA